MNSCIHSEKKFVEPLIYQLYAPDWRIAVTIPNTIFVWLKSVGTGQAGPDKRGVGELITAVITTMVAPDRVRMSRARKVAAGLRGVLDPDPRPVDSHVIS